MSAVKDVNSPLLTQTTKAPTSQTPAMPTGPKSQAPDAATATIAPKPIQTNLTPITPRKADTALSWGAPAGLPIRSNNDENLIIFRKALGINYHREAAEAGTLEEGRRSAIGIYRSVIEAQTTKFTQHALLQAFLYIVYFAQIIIGAALTALGPTAARYELAITILGAVNTILAGVLALIKGSGQPQKLGKDRIGYRRLQDWIEETESLLAVGVIGRNRKEVGLLVESAFKRYNAAKASEENNDPDYYVTQPVEPVGRHGSEDSGSGGKRVGESK
ncbi:Uu.00g008910.m01.CDS01 [Anthostomella pinea]|uniref:Uu.00g008910.m01.CDS01 n=1 Tax=Anthostomella pinea TaxID=933095 RepID=A0AAI8VX91_9PEZI|nr:Uu.00g008910.m01.CDS01 [Anthostomella pinea]